MLNTGERAVYNKMYTPLDMKNSVHISTDTP